MSRAEREHYLMALAERLLVIETALDEQIDTLGEALPEADQQSVTSWEMRRIRVPSDPATRT